VRLEPRLFKITDEETGNTVAFFDSYEAAELRLRYLGERYPDRAKFLLLVSMDKEGRPLEARAVNELVQSA
jgi:Rad3-related DNA helicase